MIKLGEPSPWANVGYDLKERRRRQRDSAGMKWEEEVESQIMAPSSVAATMSRLLRQSVLRCCGKSIGLLIRVAAFYPGLGNRKEGKGEGRIR